jgi:uncharacterized protein YjbI with pentapeptide repeats
MSADRHVEILLRGVETWNTWRAENPSVKPVLVGADLSDENLGAVNLAEADLTGADLFQTDLEKANLKMAILRDVDLSGAKLSGADLYKVDASGATLIETDLEGVYAAESTFTGCDLRGARLADADLSGADLAAARLTAADLRRANLTRADIRDADLRDADLASAILGELTYGSFRSMRGHYHGIRGLKSASGNALFVRDARDQDYLDTLERRIEATPSPVGRTWRRFWFRAWGLIDYGRGLARLGTYALTLALAFGVLYSLDMRLGWGLMDYSSSAGSWLSPFYYSIVTYTTLGFGDITPKHWIGEIIVVVEVVLGYVTLGMLLSILADRVARRS